MVKKPITSFQMPNRQNQPQSRPTLTPFAMRAKPVSPVAPPSAIQPKMSGNSQKPGAVTNPGIHGAIQAFMPGGPRILQSLTNARNAPRQASSVQPTGLNKNSQNQNAQRSAGSQQPGTIIQRKGGNKVDAFRVRALVQRAAVCISPSRFAQRWNQRLERISQTCGFTSGQRLRRLARSHIRGERIFISRRVSTIRIVFRDKRCWGTSFGMSSNKNPDACLIPLVMAWPLFRIMPEAEADRMGIKAAMMPAVRKP